MKNFDYEILARFYEEYKFIVNAEKYTEDEAVQLFIEKGNMVDEMRVPNIDDVYEGLLGEELILDDDPLYFKSVWVLDYEDLYI